MNIADVTLKALNEKQTQVMVGLDTDPTKIPELFYTKHNMRPHEAVLQFNKEIIDAVAPLVGIVKINNAFYEAMGWQGYKALEDTIKYAHDKGLIVVSDGKRNDIGNTAEQYAKAQFEILGADFATVNYYMGKDTLEPWLKHVETGKHGIFILDVTSNPGYNDLQGRTVILDENEIKNPKLDPDDSHTASLGMVVGNKINEIAKQYIGEMGYSPVGAVIGATQSKEMADLRGIIPVSINLYPGYGAQGGAAEKLINGFNSDGLGGVVNNSRNVIFAFDRFFKPEFDEMKKVNPEEFKKHLQTMKKDMLMFTPEQYIEAAVHSVKQSVNEINGLLYSAGKLPQGWQKQVYK